MPENKKTVQQQIAEARDKLITIHGQIALYMTQPMNQRKRARVLELQNRLEFRTLQYELQLLNEKVEIYGDTLKILKAR